MAGAYQELHPEDASWITWKVDAVGFVLGLIMCAVLNFAYSIVFPTEHLRFLFGSGLVMSAVGSEYFGCALMTGNIKHFMLEFNMFLLVPLLVAIGLAMETPLVAWVWLLHPIYDLLHHPAYMVAIAEKIGAAKVHPKMSWYPMWCAGIDIAQGVWILYHYAPEHLSYNLL
eukprot:TRINITY_DN58655_c0_g1_i1.p1 TRINITY_DN58655_c0_g1~~TRINITY_DN58655_c0_g1_i1.p1  ORF type:complete len:171 (+),score=29.45 TRINITY_DN58655_c0_g1_i1:107-619(+)